MPTRGAISQQSGDLTIFQFAHRATILFSDPDGSSAFLGNTCLIQDPDAFLLAKTVDDELLEAIPCLLYIPGRPIEQALHAVGRVVVQALSQLPARFPFERSQESAHILASLLPRFAARKQILKAGTELSKRVDPAGHVFLFHQII